MALFVWETTGTSASDSGSRGYTRTFAVWDEDDDTRFLGPREVLAAPGLPAFGDPFVNDLGEADRESVCSGLSGRPSPETPAIWFVEVTYSSGSESTKEANDESPAESAGGVGPVTGGAVNPESPAGGEGGGEGGGDGGAANSPPTVVENPLLRPAKFAWSTARYPVVVERDKDGNLIANSAGKPFDPPITRDDIRPVLTVRKNLPLAMIDANFIQAYVDSINQSAWFGFLAGTLLLKDFSAEDAHENGVWFWACTFVFEHKSDKWNPIKVLDQGFEEAWPGEGWTTILDLSGRPVTRPALLNGTGQELPEGGDPVFLDFDLGGEVEFGELGLF